MPDVEIYTKGFCGFCRRAKALLDGRGVAYEEIDVSWDPEAEAAMIRRAGGAYTVPQVFIHGRHIGGSDELAALEAAGKLDAILGDASSTGDET